MKKTLCLIVLLYSLASHSQNTGIGTVTPLRKLHIAGGVRIDTLAGTEDGFVKFNSDGDLVRFPQSNNPAHVLRGDGTWGAVPGGSTTLPPGTIVGTPLYENPALINLGYSLVGELPLTAYYNELNETFNEGRWAPTYIKGQIGKRQPLEPSFIPGVVWAPETARMYVGVGGYIQSYDPIADQWDSVSRYEFVFFPPAELKMVWTGTQLLLWGGDDFNTNANGVRYTPSTNTWQTITTVNQPALRSGHTVIWAGNRMIVWGGQDASGNILNDGAMYDPVTDTWTTMSTIGQPSVRKNHTAVWVQATNSLIIWGGSSTAESGPGDALSTGAIFRPATNSWTAPTNTINAPSPRFKHSAVWTGTEMIVFGGFDVFNALNTGYRYNPAGSGTWTPLPVTDAPTGVYDHAATWTGSAMVITGGISANGPTQAVAHYDRGADSWYTTAYPSYTTNAKRGKYRHYSVQADNIMIIYGGYDEVPRNQNEYPTYEAASNTGYRLFLAPTVSNATFLSSSAIMYLYMKN
jgi:N-acetylneuraminic acid mutarotase